MASGAGAIDRPVLPLSPDGGVAHLKRRTNAPADGGTRFPLAPNRPIAPSRRNGRVSRQWQLLAPETDGAWLGPVLLAAALFARRMAGAFQHADGRLFERGPSRAPKR